MPSLASKRAGSGCRRPYRFYGLGTVLLAVLCACVLTGCELRDPWGLFAQTDASDATGPASLAPDTPQLPDTSELAARTETQDGMAFAALDAEAQNLYLQLLAGVRTLEESFEVRTQSIDCIQPAYHALMVDHPELFWLDGSTRYLYVEGLERVQVTPGLTLDAGQIEPVRARIEEETNAFLRTIPEGANDYTKARLAYAYLIEHTDYVAGCAQSQNIQSVFLYHESVCAGYARAYQYLLQRAGVYCSFVEGTIPSSGAEHAWNIALVDGVYTYVDTTWGDPTYTGAGIGTEGAAAVQAADVAFDYLGLTTEELLRDDHLFADPSPWPECSSTAANYYVREGLVFDAYDEQLLGASLTAQFSCGRTPACFKFTNPEAYAQAKAALEAQNFLPDALSALLGDPAGGSYRYSYTCSDTLRIIKIYP